MGTSHRWRWRARSARRRVPIHEGVARSRELVDRERRRLVLLFRSHASRATIRLKGHGLKRVGDRQRVRPRAEPMAFVVGVLGIF